VQHVRIRHHDPAVPPDPPPHVRRGVSVVDLGLPRRVRVRRPGDEVVELGGLIPAQRLRRKQIQRRPPVVHRVEDRQVVAEAFAAGRRRDHDGVIPLHHALDRLRLMAVEPVDAPVLQHRLQPRVERLRERSVLGLPFRNVLDRRQMLSDAPPLFPLPDQFSELGLGSFPLSTHVRLRRLAPRRSTARLH